MSDIRVTMLHLSLGLLLLWFLGYQCWRAYRIDLLRQELFRIRDEMFLFAADTGTFTDPAYTWLRSVMNGMIRFAHRVTFVRFVFSIIINTVRPLSDALRPYEEWRAVLAKLPPDAQRQLENYHERMHVAVLRHMVTGSPLLVIIVTVFAIGMLVRGMIRRLLGGLPRLLEAFAADMPGVGAGLELLEDQALRARLEDLSRRQRQPAPAF